ncbi:hypothetical protein BC833DRAFT_524051, partial [Globomyces pollinis-pini]
LEMYSILLASTIYAASYCPVADKFCIATELKSDSSICWTIDSAAAGWAAIGLGSKRMADSDMYMGWKNTTDGITLANKKSTGHGQPAFNSIQNAVLVPTVVDRPKWSKLSFSFCRNVTVSAANGATITNNLNYIYAFSNVMPKGNVDAASNPIHIHSDGDYGTFSFDFLGSETGHNHGESDHHDEESHEETILQASSAFPLSTVIIIHGILMFIAWVVVPFVAIFVARYLKNVIPTRWFTIHFMLLGVVTGVLTIVSAILVFLYIDERNPYFDTLHAKLGVAIVIVMLCQIALGVISDRKFSPQRHSVPWWDILHWWIGRILTIAGLVNSYFGIALVSEFSNDAYIPFITCFGIVIGLGVFSFVYGEVYYGQVHHLEKVVTEDVDGDESKTIVVVS